MQYACPVRLVLTAARGYGYCVCAFRCGLALRMRHRPLSQGLVQACPLPLPRDPLQRTRDRLGDTKGGGFGHSAFGIRRLELPLAKLSVLASPRPWWRKPLEWEIL